LEPSRIYLRLSGLVLDQHGQVCWLVVAVPGVLGAERCLDCVFHDACEASTARPETTSHIPGGSFPACEGHDHGRGHRAVADVVADAREASTSQASTSQASTSQAFFRDGRRT
jgi:hypothetical protein